MGVNGASVSTSVFANQKLVVKYGSTSILCVISIQCKCLFPHAKKANFNLIEMTTQNRGTSVLETEAPLTPMLL